MTVKSKMLKQPPRPRHDVSPASSPVSCEPLASASLQERSSQLPGGHLAWMTNLSHSPDSERPPLTAQALLSLPSHTPTHYVQMCVLCIVWHIYITHTLKICLVDHFTYRELCNMWHVAGTQSLFILRPCQSLS